MFRNSATPAFITAEQRLKCQEPRRKRRRSTCTQQVHIVEQVGEQQSEQQSEQQGHRNNYHLDEANNSQEID